MKPTPQSILREARRRHAVLLALCAPVYAASPETMAELDALARAAGFIHLRPLATYSASTESIAGIARTLVNLLAWHQSEAAGLGTWDSLGEFLFAADPAR